MYDHVDQDSSALLGGGGGGVEREVIHSTVFVLCVGPSPLL